MPPEIVLSARNLSKAYQIAETVAQPTTLAEALLTRLQRPFQKSRPTTFQALKDVTFDIQGGQVVGLIGRNGAGKSTLLKVLSRITEPTSGTASIKGRVGSLLEVGTGFHPELTGRENIFLNGAILGMRRKAISQSVDAIVAFADVERFLDTPVKRYSSGMYVRLAFAVAAHLNPDILIIDEVLAVGDIQFQQKCLGRMKQVSQEEGRTVLFVSHNMAAISALCDRVLLFENGTLQLDGTPAQVVGEYLSQHRTSSEIQLPIIEGGISLDDIEVVTEGERRTLSVLFNDPCTITLTFHAKERTIPLVPKLSIFREDGLHVVDLWGSEEGYDYQSFHGSWRLTVSTNNLMLLPALYRVDVSYYARGEGYKFQAQGVLSIDILEANLPDGARSYTSAHGITRPFEKFAIGREACHPVRAVT